MALEVLRFGRVVGREGRCEAWGHAGRRRWLGRGLGSVTAVSGLIGLRYSCGRF
jgi:hypothetical protein